MLYFRRGKPGRSLVKKIRPYKVVLSKKIFIRTCLGFRQTGQDKALKIGKYGNPNKLSLEIVKNAWK